MHERPTPAVVHLRTTAAVRERSARLLDLARRGGIDAFVVRDQRLSEAAALVADVTRARYPSLEVPFHSRYRHFGVGGVDRLAELDVALAGASREDRARAKIDLVVVSVLLDAGAGPDWSYREGDARFGRSEGLAVASYRMFRAGVFSSDPSAPLRADAAGLRALSASALALGFQINDANPLIGLEGRASLLRNLGAALEARPDLFGRTPPRPGGLLDSVATRGDFVRAADVLALVLEGLSPIWPGRVVLDGENLGDVWPHPGLEGPTPADGLVPFHKLSQWLTYSLLEPLGEAGLRVVELDELTGLPEYRNGGLLLDTGVLALRDPRASSIEHAVGSPLVVAWRALTVALLDELAPLVRARLDRPDLPLASVLEGGTWAAGREIAARSRPGGTPPLRVMSDGTVF